MNSQGRRLFPLEHATGLAAYGDRSRRQPHGQVERGKKYQVDEKERMRVRKMKELREAPRVAAGLRYWIGASLC